MIKKKLTLEQLILIELILISAVVVSVLSFNIVAYNVRSEQLDEIKELADNPQTTLEEQRESFQDMKDIKKALNITQ